MKKILIIVLAVFALLFFYTNKQIGVSDDDNVLSDKKELVNKSNKIGSIESNDKTKSLTHKKSINSVSNSLEPEIQQALENHLNTSSEGLTEDETDDGYSVDLQGRFRSVPVATIQEDGEIFIKDYTSLPKQSNK
ncbi:MAG: hypothetical protein QM500_06210 [Methylococcales bacterium]